MDVEKSEAFLQLFKYISKLTLQVEFFFKVVELLIGIALDHFGVNWRVGYWVFLPINLTLFIYLIVMNVFQ